MEESTVQVSTAIGSTVADVCTVLALSLSFVHISKGIYEYFFYLFYKLDL